MKAPTQSAVPQPHAERRDGPFVIRTHKAPLREDQHLRALRALIWLYFWLLIFEGALRKWIAPSLSAPLLVIRDPLALLIYVQALRYRRFQPDALLLPLFALVSCFLVLAVFQITLSIGGGVLVSLYGLRTNFLHLPLIFILPQVLSREDVLRIGKWTLILALPMTLLMVLQFFSPPNSWLNAATIAEGQQIQSALGRIRPAGTFSFATGVAHFYVLATTFAVYGLLERKAPYPKWLLWAAVVSIAAVQPVSGSRLLVLGCRVGPGCGNSSRTPQSRPGRTPTCNGNRHRCCSRGPSVNQLLSRSCCCFHDALERCQCRSGRSKTGTCLAISWGLYRSVSDGAENRPFGKGHRNGDQRCIRNDDWIFSIFARRR